MTKLFKNKAVITGITIASAVIITVTVMMISKQILPVNNSVTETPEISSNIKIQTPEANSKQTSSSKSETDEIQKPITVDVGSNKDSDITSDENSPSAQMGNSTATDTKKPPKPDGSVSVGTGRGPEVNPDKTPSNPTGGVVSVEPVERGDEPRGASGVTPKLSDWVSVSDTVPQELYAYDYTIINNEDLITGAQMKWRGYSDWARAANATIGGLTQYYTIDYRNIKSTNPNDRDEYLTSLVYWTGESAHMDICEYMKNAVNHKIISTASVVTDGSLTYNNGVQLIRARVFVTWQSGADYYGLKNGVKYYKDVEVAVYRSNGEDRYGFGKGNDFNSLLFSDNCFNSLCTWKKA